MAVIPFIALSGAGSANAGAVRVRAQQRDVVGVQTAAASPLAMAGAVPVEATSTTLAPVALDTAAPAVATTVTTAPPATETAHRLMVVRPAAAPRPTVTSPHPTVALRKPAAPATTEPHVTTSTAPRPSQTGPASWYDAPPGTCAHPNLPFGTIVTVVNLASGATATCTVEDRGPYAGGRIIDLAPDVFARLAPTSDGIINVRISW